MKYLLYSFTFQFNLSNRVRPSSSSILYWMINDLWSSLLNQSSLLNKRSLSLFLLQVKNCLQVVNPPVSICTKCLCPTKMKIFEFGH